MFRELTYEELGFVSGGKPDQPPTEPPPPDIEIVVTPDTITVTGSSDGGGQGGFFEMTYTLPEWNFGSLTLGYAEGGSSGSVTFEAEDGQISGTFTHDFGDVTMTAEVFTAGQEGPGALIRISYIY
jgi:hypothetical protein